MKIIFEQQDLPRQRLSPTRTETLSDGDDGEAVVVGRAMVLIGTVSTETTGNMHVVTGVGQEDKFSFYYGSNGFLKQKTRCVVGLKHKTFKFNNPHKLEL